MLRKVVQQSRQVALKSGRSSRCFSATNFPDDAQHQVAQHYYDDEANPSEAEFQFEDMDGVNAILAKYPSNYKRSGVIPLLWKAQRQSGNWIPLAAMKKIAEHCDVAPMRVYEVATFYSQFNRRQLGAFHLQLCGTTPCMVCGSEDIKNAILQHLGIELGETTSDGMFTVTEVECLGACVNAPMMQVNNELFYEDLTVENVIPLLDQIVKGSARVGPQGERKTCIGTMGKTSLLEPMDPFTTYRDLAAMKKELEAKPTEQ